MEYFCKDKSLLAFISKNSSEPSLSKLLTYCLKSELAILPGFCDVHVHFREPGFSYKETIGTGSLAAAHSGYTTVCTMPNLNPVPDCFDSLNEQLSIIEKDAAINVIPYASITKRQAGLELSDFDALYNNVVAFSDDGRGVQDEALMKQAMLKAKELGKVIVAHCEDNSLLNGGYIHKGKYALENNHLGICSESEWKPIERDINLCKETGCAYHVCHISTKESVELIRQAKKDGINITCETGPHYLILCDEDLQEEGRFKMNPPLRSNDDRDALIEGIIDGTIDCIATDHAPHSAEEKSKGLSGSAFGIVGLETAFPLMYTHFVKTGIISMDKLMNLMVYNPSEIFNLPLNESFCIWDLNKSYNIDSAKFYSMGKATPFEGYEVYGECLANVCNGEIIFNKLF